MAHKQESFIDESMHMAHEFNLWEVALFELYIFAWGLIAAKLFPGLLNIPTGIYLILTVVGAIYIYWVIFLKNKHLGQKLARKGWKLHLLKRFDMLDMSLYKLTVFVCALFVAQIFPQILNLHFVWPLGIAMFGLGYFLALMSHHKKLYHK